MFLEGRMPLEFEVLRDLCQGYFYLWTLIAYQQYTFEKTVVCYYRSIANGPSTTLKNRQYTALRRFTGYFIVYTHALPLSTTTITHTHMYNTQFKHEAHITVQV